MNITLQNIYGKTPEMIKTFFVLVYTFMIKVLGFAILGIQLINIQYIFFFLLLTMFLPELGITFSKSFRNWLKGGVEDKKGVDLSSLLLNYSTLWSLRLYVIFSLMEIFYNIQIREIYIYTSLAGAFSLKSIEILSRLIVQK